MYYNCVFYYIVVVSHNGMASVKSRRNLLYVVTLHKHARINIYTII